MVMDQKIRSFLRNWWSSGEYPEIVTFWGQLRICGWWVREYFLREIGYWKIWICADIVYKKTGPVSVHDLHHVTALARPSLRISGEPPRSVLLRQHCRVGSFRWKWGVSPRQNCLKDNWASHLVSTEVIYIGAIFAVGKGTLIALDALAGSLPSVFRCPLAGCGTAHFSDILHRSRYPDQEHLMAHRIIMAFLHSVHGQPFISPLSLSNFFTQLLVQMDSLCWLLFWFWI